MKFSEALELMLAGKAVAREGDYAHNRIFLANGNIDASTPDFEQLPSFGNSATSEVPLRYFDVGDEGTATRLPRFDAKDANDNTVTGWTPTAVDLLSEYWDLAENINIPFELEFGAEEAA